MKKIVTALIILIFSIGTLYAQDIPQDLTQEEPDDFGSIIGDLTNDTAAKEFNFGQYIDPETTSSEEIKDILTEAGVSEEEIQSMDTVIEGIADGTINTLAEAEAVNPDIYDNIENAVIRIAADKAVEQLLGSGEQGDELREQIGNLSKALNALSGFGQANAQGSRASSLFGYQGYKLFALSLGTTISLATDDPNGMLEIVQSDSAAKDLENKINDSGISAGISIQGFTANVGVNMSWLVDNLYLGAIVGYTGVELTPTDFIVEPMGIPITVGDAPDTGDDLALAASMSSLTLGITGNYQIIDAFKIPFLFRWNGLSAGTGIIYNSYTVDAEADLSGIFPVPEGQPKVEAGSFVATFAISNNAVTIPLELSTGINVLSVLNLSLGAGLDLQMGGSNVSFNLEGPGTEGLATKLMVAMLDRVLEEGGMAFPYSEDYSVNFFNPRVNAGVGVGIGPATLMDLTATYYINSGIVFGINFVFRL